MNRKGSTALGLLGIITVVILFELLVGYFTYAITNEQTKNIFTSECDCGTFGCNVYIATHSFNELYALCQSQISDNSVLSDAVSERFWSLTIIGIILFVINLILIIAVILILRGVPA